jgi:alpha-1,3-rhamnosyl/mannosyltransferase
VKVLVDLRPARHPISGVARYCLNLCNALAQPTGPGDDHLGVHAFVQGDHPSLQTLHPSVARERRLEAIRPTTVRNALIDLAPPMGRALGLSKFDLIHETYSARLSLGRNRPMVATVHDVIPIDAPEYYSPRIVASVRRNLARQVADARVVVCVSAYTRGRVQQLTGCDPAKLRVVGCGICETEGADGAAGSPALPRGLEPGDEFCLILGNVEDRKNLGIALRVWPRIRRDRPGLKLAIAGGVNPRTPLTLPEGVGADPSVVFLGPVSNPAKWALLRAAKLLVFPSLYEGFGIPALEAYYAGCPVVASRSSALVELLFDGRQSFDPRSEAELHNCWADALGRPAWLEDATERAHRWARTRTWGTVASEIRLIYEEAVG